MQGFGSGSDSASKSLAKASSVADALSKRLASLTSRVLATYGQRTLIAIDQLLNTLLGGWPDETLSSRCYRWARDGVRAWPRKLVDGLFFWQREHCKSSYESEREGRQSPPELRRQE